ncbi:MAG: DNA methyltransferase [Acidobacteriota bacterium]
MSPSTVASLPFGEHDTGTFADALRRFRWQGVSKTSVGFVQGGARAGESWAAGSRVRSFTNEFWTARQRAAHSLHEVSYRACFKPQLPRFFIERLTRPGEIVYDPFAGRGTTLIEAALLGRVPYGCDVNPLSRVISEPRLAPPPIAAIERALAEVDFAAHAEAPDELLVFYHPDTLRQISALREHLLRREREGTLTAEDRWIRMVAVNRLTGHSSGFFSVYTMPPNQAVSLASQAKINARRDQTPPRRDVPTIILRKSRSLLADVSPELRTELADAADRARIYTSPSAQTPGIAARSVSLVVTSPPFLDVVDYQTDNWLRCWFCGIDAEAVPITQARGVDQWRAFVQATLAEIQRVLAPGGHVAFEVGEVKGGTLRLEEIVIPAGVAAGLEPLLVLINEQRFTKTANCWGVTNNRKGTNTNRVVVFRNAG